MNPAEPRGSSFLSGERLDRWRVVVLVGVSEGLAQPACALCVKCLIINPNEIGFIELNWKLCGISCRNVFRNVVQTLRSRVQYAEKLTQY